MPISLQCNVFYFYNVYFHIYISVLYDIHYRYVLQYLGQTVYNFDIPTFRSFHCVDTKHLVAHSEQWARGCYNI